MNVLRIDPLHCNVPELKVLSTMEETFLEHGHKFVQSADQADIALFDLSCGDKRYDSGLLRSVVNTSAPVVAFDEFEYSNPPATDSTWLGRGTKYDIEKENEDGAEWAFWMKQFLGRHQVKLYFIRRMPSKWIEFPDFVRPMDMIMYPGHDFTPVDEGNLSARLNDVCFLGSYHPGRENTVSGLEKTGLKLDCHWIRHDQRMSHNEWLDRHRAAKLFFSGDGPGDCSDRPHQLIYIAPMLKYRNFHRLPVQWRHGFDCIEAASEFGEMDERDERIIRDFLESPQKLHQIYLNGIDHMHNHNTPKARTEYILRELKGVGVS